MTRKFKIIMVAIAAFFFILASIMTLQLMSVPPPPQQAPPVQICEHQFKDGVCELCGFCCKHAWNDDVCSVCGLSCAHAEYKDGACTVCGKLCEHESFSDGQCKTCGYQCEHEMHDAETQLCSKCGEKQAHRYTSGVCVCGKHFEHVTAFPDRSIMDPCTEHGAVEIVEYDVPFYEMQTDMRFHKAMTVYLPFGYDSEKQYNVAFMYHGSGGSCFDWTNSPVTIGGDTIVMQNIYDNMIREKTCQPFIVVSLATGCYDPIEERKKDNTDFQNAEELRNIVVPYVVEHYATYAASSEVQDIQNARQHFAVGGDSMGAIFAEHCGMAHNFDLFGNFIFISGDNSTTALSEIESPEWKDLPIYCYYCGAGNHGDKLKHPMESAYTHMMNHCKRLHEGENAWYELADFGHDWRTFAVEFYNAIQVAFQELN